MWVRSASECSLRFLRMISKWSPRLLWVCSDNSGKKCESGGNIDTSQKVDCSTIWEALQTQKSNQTFDNDPQLYRSCGLFCTLTETQTKRFQKLDVWWELKIIMTGFKSKSLEHLWLLSNQKIACSKLWCQSSLRFLYFASSCTAASIVNCFIEASVIQGFYFVHRFWTHIAFLRYISWVVILLCALWVRLNVKWEIGKCLPRPSF